MPRRRRSVAATAVNTATIATGATDQRTAYLTAASMIEASPTGTATAGNLADSTKFQTGDTFAISFTNSSGSTTTRHFYAGAAPPITAGTPPVTVPRTGVSQNLAMGFTDAAGLVSAFTAAFGSDDIGLSVDAAGKLALSAVNSATTITISQTSNVTPLNGVPSGTANAFLDFDKIFGASTTRTGGTGLTVNNGGTATTGVVGTQSTYTGTGNAATPANLETRRLASDTYKITLLQLANVAKDAYLPGFANLLTGNTMSIDLNEDAGDVVQNVSIGGAVDPSSLGFGGFNAQTGADNTTANNFGNDVDMTSAVNKVTAAMTTLRSRQNALANHTTMLSTRLEFNKSYQSTTSDLATSITSADMTAEAANMAALQNLQAFATNNLSVTKNAEASLIQLLR